MDNIFSRERGRLLSKNDKGSLAAAFVCSARLGQRTRLATRRM